jgi:putative flavoprotein involved in K+ transport
VFNVETVGLSRTQNAIETRRQAMSGKTPTEQVSEWLATLDSALQRGDVAAAAALFGADSYWRDLVSFTWNITTAEGNANVSDMIERAVIPAEPFAWQLEGEAGESGGVTEVWIRFETGVARGYGHLRLVGGKAWTLLTTLTELKGFEELKGPTREQGVEHGLHPGRKIWLERRS